MLPDLRLDPNSTGKIAVCSLHFKAGHPTPEFPSPTELLSSKDSENATEFRGTKPTTESVEVLKINLVKLFSVDPTHIKLHVLVSEFRKY